MSSVIFLHGAGMDGRMWAPHLELLSRPGLGVTLSHFGAKPDRSRPYGLTTHCDDVRRAVADLNGPVSLVGWSFGCIPALEAALKLEGKVERVVIFEPGAPEFVSENDMPAFGKDAEQFYGPVAELVPAGRLHEASIEMMEQSGGKGIVDRLDPFFRTIAQDNEHSYKTLFEAEPPVIEPERYSDIGCPIDVCWGSQSRDVFRLPSKGAASLFGSDRSGAVDGCDHLWPMTDPASFVEFVEAKLS